MHAATEPVASWHTRVVDRSLSAAKERSIDRGSMLIRAATAVLVRSGGNDFTVQDVADEARQSLRTLYQYFESKDDLLLAVFEEAMSTYASLVSNAIEDLDDPFDRLVGSVLAMTSLTEFKVNGIRGGLARMRLKLTSVEPRLVGQARRPLVAVLRAVLSEAATAGIVADADAEVAMYMIISLNTASTTSQALGNDTGVAPPDVDEIAAFCLRALGVALAPGWAEAMRPRLRLPRGVGAAARP